ncbi:methyltransferase, putative [Hepatocystis sp. ex Piliocolobus tephrosceles]|uniref:EEF1A lysine and N-terminal methyltransferase homolog n=1 Tax=Piliocolobus tephrosceles TaxID=591936 RepID=A0A8C9H563_9PRIM|nr:methyltransferase, putative [Hepatocystis sp. ex Piliocolobus tephrosceles]
MAVYGNISYWNERYSKEEEQFDWHQKWCGIKHIFSELNIRNDAKILNIGCGTSKLSEEMLENGFTSITNIDASSVCIQKMQELYKDQQNLKYMLMNVCDMKQFKNAEFDVIIDKACLDSVLCSEDSLKNVEEMLSEVARVLKSDGTFIIISHAQPNYRLGYLQKEEYKWSVTIKTVKRPMLGVVAPPVDDCLHYVYICKKGSVITEQ